MEEDSDGGMGAISTIVEPAGLCPVQIHEMCLWPASAVAIGKAQGEVAWQMTAILLLSKGWDAHCTCHSTLTLLLSKACNTHSTRQISHDPNLETTI